MTTVEQNMQLTQTGPGTPMGAVFRRYWLPALLARELPEPDCPPVRVKLLGERLIAFRDTAGRIGLIDEFCAHRGVSLWFGRNEEGGIRCPYHGWKYDHTGQCMEIPSEPEESGYCRKIKLTSYPCVERGGVIWAYLGPPELQPSAPDYQWCAVPDSHCYVSKRVQECNYLQAMEGGLDSIHSTFLHRYSVGEDPLLKRDAESAVMLKADPHPKFIPTQSPGGLHISTRRNVGDDRFYWRVTQWLMPCFNLFPPYGDNPCGGHAWVPIDDEHCWTFSIDYHQHRPLNATELEACHDGKGIHVKVIENSFVPQANIHNMYFMDRRAQQEKKTFSGVMTIGIQDAAVQESMGAIEDRSRENLVSTDNGIIMTRNRLLQVAKDVASGKTPPGLDTATQRVRAISMVAPRSQGFSEALAAHEASLISAEATA